MALDDERRKEDAVRVRALVAGMLAEAGVGSPSSLSRSVDAADMDTDVVEGTGPVVHRSQCWGEGEGGGGGGVSRYIGVCIKRVCI